MSIAPRPATVQAPYRPTVAIQIQHYGRQLDYLAAFLCQQEYSDGAREAILSEAGEHGTLDHSIAAHWLEPDDQVEAQAMLTKGFNEVAARLLWRARNESRSDWPSV